MNILKFLEDATGYYPKDDRNLLRILMKSSNSLKYLPPTKIENKTPVLFFKEEGIELKHTESDVYNYPVVFTDPGEMALIIQSEIFKGSTIYISLDN